MGLSECLTLLLGFFSGRLCLAAHSITTRIYFRQRTRRVEIDHDPGDRELTGDNFKKKF